MPSTPVHRLAHIDALRGLAALLVVWLHVTEVFIQLPGRPADAWLYDIAASVDTGRIGVVLFFAISGFVIPSSLPPTVDRQGVPSALRVFAVRRFFRLFPAYWLSLAGAALMGRALHTPLPPATLAANLTMLQGWFGVPDALGLYWSLRLELVFYALCAGLFALRGLHRPAALAGAIVACGAVVAAAVGLRALAAADTVWPQALVYLPLYALFIATMFWGALFRQWHDQRHQQSGQKMEAPVRAVFWLFAAGVLLGPLAVPLLHAWVPGSASTALWRMAIAQALGLGLFLLLGRGGWQPGRLARWVGEGSYALYLFHPLVFYPLFIAVQRGHLPWLDGAPLAVSLALSLAGSLLLATAVHRGVEQPAIRWGRRLTAG